MGLFKKMITVNEGINKCRNDKNAELVDIRPKDEYKKGHVPGSINIPLANIEMIQRRIPSKEKTLYIIGSYKALHRTAVKTLKKMGYQNVIESGYMEEHHGFLAK